MTDNPRCTDTRFYLLPLERMKYYYFDVKNQKLLLVFTILYLYWNIEMRTFH